MPSKLLSLVAHSACSFRLEWLRGANNNARNYAVVNALDLEALLGLPVGNGNPIPPAIEETLHERAEGKLGGPTLPDVEPAPGSAKPKR